MRRAHRAGVATLATRGDRTWARISRDRPTRVSEVGGRVSGALGGVAGRLASLRTVADAYRDPGAMRDDAAVACRRAGWMLWLTGSMLDHARIAGRHTWRRLDGSTLVPASHRRWSTQSDVQRAARPEVARRRRGAEAERLVRSPRRRRHVLRVGAVSIGARFESDRRLRAADSLRQLNAAIGRDRPKRNDAVNCREARRSHR